MPCRLNLIVNQAASFFIGLGVIVGETPDLFFADDGRTAGGMITTSGSIVAIRLSRSSAFTPAKNSSPSFLIAFTSSSVVEFVSRSPPSAGNIPREHHPG
jgi:hypothetical protein